MKFQQSLSICLATALLTACGSSSSLTTTSPNNSNSQTNNSSPLPYQYEVPENLKQAVKDALNFKVYWDPAPDQHSMKIGEKTYNKGDSIDFTDFDLGYSEKSLISTQTKEVIANGKMRVYRLPYSLIMADSYDSAKLASDNTSGNEVLSNGSGFYLGHFTNNLPSTGAANYVGKSFYNEETGNFNLNVDFGNKTTEGKITGLSTGDITLAKGNIEPVKRYQDDRSDNPIFHAGFTGTAVLANGKAYTTGGTVTTAGVTKGTQEFNANDYDFKYEGHFFGPNAKEAAGLVHATLKSGNQTATVGGADLINFAGQRGDIK